MPPSSAGARLLQSLLSDRRGSADAAEDLCIGRFRVRRVWAECARSGDAYWRLDRALAMLRIHDGAVLRP